MADIKDKKSGFEQYKDDELVTFHAMKNITDAPVTEMIRRLNKSTTRLNIAMIILTIIIIGVTIFIYYKENELQKERYNKIIKNLLIESSVNVGYIDEIKKKANILSEINFLPLWRLDTTFLKEATYEVNNDTQRERMILTLININQLNSLLNEAQLSAKEENKSIYTKENKEGILYICDVIKEDLIRISNVKTIY